VQERTLQRAKDITLARLEAREIQRTHAGIFQEIPVSVTDVARALGLEIEKRSRLTQRARLEILRDAGSDNAVIAVRADLDRTVIRFAVAHEIGHAILLRKHPEAAQQWDLPRREAFASIFATELLAPPKVRADLATSFRALSDPVALLRLASRFGLSPHALLTLCTHEHVWFEDLKKIWLRVKYTENVHTHRDPKLRIVSAHYDWNRFFIAPNQSFTRFAGDDQWLASLPQGVVARHKTAITVKFRRPSNAVPKFVSKEVQAELSAVRLQPSTPDPGAYLIILVEVAECAPAEASS
jgi:hypothetical protein